MKEEDTLGAHGKASHVQEITSDKSLWIKLIEEFKGKN